MLLLGKKLIEDCKEAHPTLRSKLDAFTELIEKGKWKTPVEMKGTLASADPVGEYYAIDVGGKKGARIIVLVQFAKQAVLVHKIFTDHSKYQKWSSRAKAEYEKLRKQGKKKS